MLTIYFSRFIKNKQNDSISKITLKNRQHYHLCISFSKLWNNIVAPLRRSSATRDVAVAVSYLE